MTYKPHDVIRLWLTPEPTADVMMLVRTLRRSVSIDPATKRTDAPTPTGNPT